MNLEIFVWMDEKQAGPFSVDQIWEMIRSGKISADAAGLVKGNLEWKPLGDLLKEIQEAQKVIASKAEEQERAKKNEDPVWRWWRIGMTSFWFAGLMAVIAVLALFSLEGHVAIVLSAPIGGCVVFGMACMGLHKLDLIVYELRRNRDR